MEIKPTLGQQRLSVPNANPPRIVVTDSQEITQNDENIDLKKKAKTQVSKAELNLGQENIKKAQNLAQQYIQAKK